jgi:hypothetical protein
MAQQSQQGLTHVKKEGNKYDFDSYFLFLIGQSRCFAISNLPPICILCLILWVGLENNKESNLSM